MSVLPLPRTLAHVLLEIARVEHALRSADQACERAVYGSPEEAAASDRYAAIDSRLLELRAEARRMIEMATGVSFRQIEEAGL